MNKVILICLMLSLAITVTVIVTTGNDATSGEVDHSTDNTTEPTGGHVTDGLANANANDSGTGAPESGHEGGNGLTKKPMA